MVRADSGISSVADFAGKIVNIGNPGSGTRVLAETLLAAAGVSVGDLALAAELKSSEQSAALCDGKIDATSGTADILAANGAYAAATVPAGMYPNNPDDIASWGPKATFVTSANTSDEVVYALVSAVFENFDAFKKLHPAFGRLVETDMIVDGLSADLHPGAVKYYKERGWM